MVLKGACPTRWGCCSRYSWSWSQHMVCITTISRPQAAEAAATVQQCSLKAAAPTRRVSGASKLRIFTYAAILCMQGCSLHFFMFTSQVLLSLGKDASEMHLSWKTAAEK